MPLIEVKEENKTKLNTIGRKLAIIKDVKSVSYDEIITYLIMEAQK